MHATSISFSSSRERVPTYMRNPKREVDVQADSRTGLAREHLWEKMKEQDYCNFFYPVEKFVVNIKNVFLNWIIDVFIHVEWSFEFD